MVPGGSALDHASGRRVEQRPRTSRKSGALLSVEVGARPGRDYDDGQVRIETVDCFFDACDHVRVEDGGRMGLGECSLAQYAEESNYSLWYGPALFTPAPGRTEAGAPPGTWGRKVRLTRFSSRNVLGGRRFRRAEGPAPGMDAKQQHKDVRCSKRVGPRGTCSA